MKKLQITGMLLLVLFMFSCRKGGTLLKEDALSVVPADVSSVTAIKPAQLLDKANFEEVKNMAFFKDLLDEVKKENNALAKIIADPYQSGIDLEKNIYFTQDINAKNPNDIFSAVMFSVKDKSVLKALAQEAGAQAFEEGPGYEYAKLGRKGSFALNDKYGMIGMNNKSSKLKRNLDKIFSTTKETAVNQNLDLAKCLKSDADILSWASSNTLAENPEAKLALGMLNINSEDLKDNYFHNHLTFENGKVDGLSTYYLQKGLTKDLKLFFKKNVETNFLKKVPGEGLGYTMALAVDPKGINQVMSEKPQIKSFVEYALQEYGLTMSDIARAFNGDVFVGGYDDGENSADFLVAVAIDDEDTFNKFLPALKEYGKLTDLGNGMYGSQDAQLNFSGVFNPAQTRLLIKDDLLYVSNNVTLIEQISAGGFKTAHQANKKMTNLMETNVFSMLLDFETFTSDNEVLKSLDIENLQITSGKNKSKFDMLLKDKTNNSLNALLKMADKMYLENKAKNPNAKSI